MEIRADRAYPNGISKLRLYQTFLNYRDFACTPEKYEEDVEFLRLEDLKKECNCEWGIDVDGTAIVAGLELRSARDRVIVTERGFVVMPKIAPRVFVSYAREDSGAAARLARELATEGFQPWFDKDELFPGERWEAAIERGIRSSDYFVAFLSKNSVNKRGYVQKEIRRALGRGSRARDIPHTRTSRRIRTFARGPKAFAMG
ncbi:MAG TPA: toll/interleukin-1 receptor domain-containing protein [Thermoanaerobaculia bacterium]